MVLAIKDENAARKGVPAKQLDALMVLAIKDENAARKGDIFISERTSLYSPLIPLRMSIGCWHM